MYKKLKNKNDKKILMYKRLKEDQMLKILRGPLILT